MDGGGTSRGCSQHQGNKTLVHRAWAKAARPSSAEGGSRPSQLLTGATLGWDDEDLLGQCYLCFGQEPKRREIEEQDFRVQSSSGLTLCSPRL